MALPSDSHAEGMGSISELFPPCHRENSAGFSDAESATHPGVPAVCSQCKERMEAPGAACAAQKELEKSHSAWGRCGCGEGTFVKTGLFGITRAAVPGKPVCV